MVLRGKFITNDDIKKKRWTWCSVVKNLPVTTGDTGDIGSIPGSGRYPGEGNDNPLMYPCLEIFMNRGY